MAKTTFASLKLKSNNSVKTINYNESLIEVNQYLPIEDKYDLIMITAQKALENNIYNPLKIDMYLHLHIIYLYTNITFTDKQRENESKLYDLLMSNGIMESVIASIPEDEYNFIFSMLEDYIKLDMENRRSVTALISKFIDDLPAGAQAAMNLVNKFDPEKYQAVIDFATAANGGRPILGVTKAPAAKD